MRTTEVYRELGRSLMLITHTTEPSMTEILKRDLIETRQGSKPGPLGKKPPLCHLSHRISVTSTLSSNKILKTRSVFGELVIAYRFWLFEDVEQIHVLPLGWNRFLTCLLYCAQVCMKEERSLHYEKCYVSHL